MRLSVSIPEESPYQWYVNPRRRYFHLADLELCALREKVRIRNVRLGARAKAYACALAEPSAYTSRATRDRQPDLLPSPVIIIIKSTLRAVRALVKECFISPARPLCSLLPTRTRRTTRLSTTPGLQHHLRETTSPWPSLGPSALRKPAGHVSLLLFAAHPSRYPRMLKPAEGRLLPFVQQSRGCKDRELGELSLLKRMRDQSMI